MRPSPPAVSQAPIEIAPASWLIRQLDDPVDGVRSCVNALLVLGSEPTLIDTGAPNNREQFLADLSHLTDPIEIRWLILSHDGINHCGNLDAILEICPRARVVGAQSMARRLATTVELPLTRVRWLEDGQALFTGDRSFLAVRPPVYDSPTARGLFDSTTGLFWAANAYGLVVTHPVDEAAELDRDFFLREFAIAQLSLAPWITHVEPGAWHRATQRVEALAAEVIATVHGPAIRGSLVDEAHRIMRGLPALAARPIVQYLPRPDGRHCGESRESEPDVSHEATATEKGTYP